MHFALILVLVTVASATPLGWSTTGSFPTVVTNPDSLWHHVIRPSPAQQSAQQIGEEIEQVRNVVQREGLGVEGVHNHKSDVAQQAAREVVQQALLARQRQTIEGIEDLQQRQNIVPQTMAGQISGNQAIDQLQKHLLFQQSVAPVITATSQLAKTLEAAIESQLTLENVGVQQWGGVRESSLNSGVFLAKVQQLVDQSNIQEIQTEISRQQAKIQQLEQQKLLVKQQKQQVQVRLSIVLQGQESTMQLQDVQQLLQQQEEELVSQQLARQLVIQQLQQALIEQQHQLQQDILGELQSQMWVEGGRRVGQVEGIDMISTSRQRVPYQTHQYGLLRTQIGTPWSIYGNSWSRKGNYIPMAL